MYYLVQGKIGAIIQRDMFQSFETLEQSMAAYTPAIGTGAYVLELDALPQLIEELAFTPLRASWDVQSNEWKVMPK